MLYSVAHFHYDFAEDWQRDVFEQRLADIGFEAFENQCAYIQTALLDRAMLDNLLADTDGVQLLSVAPVTDTDWNAAWETEHPSYEWLLHPTLQPTRSVPLIILPRCAFGNGTHDTTAMLLQALQQTDCRTLRHVLDNGCGTGVLAIAAALLGAQRVTATDIDEKSIANTQENATVNHVSITTLLTDTPPEGNYDLIISNIHRNILLQQMPLYASLLLPKGQLWLSGFLQADCPVLIEKAGSNGLQLAGQRHSNEWYMLLFRKL